MMLHSYDYVLIFQVNILNFLITFKKLYIANNNNKINNSYILYIISIATYIEYIQAVILPSTQLSFNYETYVNASVKISGFQELYENSIIDHRLKCVKLRIIDNNHCSDYFIEQQIVPSTLCAIGNVTQNLCGADVGSALVIYDKFIGRHIQVGIRSFISINLCDIGVSSYMRITSYLNWINEIIN